MKKKDHILSMGISLKELIKVIKNGVSEEKENELIKRFCNNQINNILTDKRRLPRPLEAWKSAKDMDCGSFCEWFLKEEEKTR